MGLGHKLYPSASRRGTADKAHKDVIQAATLAAVLVEQEDGEPLADSWRTAPLALRRSASTRLPALRRALAMHPQTLARLEDCLA